MIQTALMECFQELIIGPPPIVMKPSLPILAQYRGGLLKSAARKNVINRDLRAQAYPKPLEISGDSPTRLIHPVDLASPHRDPKLLIGGCCLDAQSDHSPGRVRYDSLPYRSPLSAPSRRVHAKRRVPCSGGRSRPALAVRSVPVRRPTRRRSAGDGGPGRASHNTRNVRSQYRSAAQSSA